LRRNIETDLRSLKRTVVTTYKKQPDGWWKAVADIASSEVPAPPPAPSSK
jgi:hypothetical protein